MKAKAWEKSAKRKLRSMALPSALMRQSGRVAARAARSSAVSWAIMAVPSGWDCVTGTGAAVLAGSLSRYMATGGGGGRFRRRFRL